MRSCVTRQSMDFGGVAVSLVVFSHAAAFRFHSEGKISNYLGRVAGPLSELGVQIFFVISGYIITSLILREKHPNIGAFYARRAFRILPPLMFYFAGLVFIRELAWIDFDPRILGNAALFTCNTNLTDCPWWTAHTWSLSVEEQYYLAWPFLFVWLGVKRAPFLWLVIATLLIVYWFWPHSWHSNFISFSCIATGALFALLRPAIKANSFIWMTIVILLVAGPLFAPLYRPIEFAMPALVLYLIFAGREIHWVRKVLESRPLQLLGASSYSLYLWQQLFLGSPELYTKGPVSWVCLPVIVVVSILVVERPFIRLGHRLSAHIIKRNTDMIAKAP